MNRLLPLLAASLLPVAAFAGESLASQLEAAAAASREKRPAEVTARMAAGTRAVAESGILDRARNVGDVAPDFTLPNPTGTLVNLKDLLRKGPVVLTWYRGGWCPYCNLTLAALQERLPEFQGAGATLVALTPELPDHSLSTSEKHNLAYPILTDQNNAVAEAYGIVFDLTADIAALYATFFDMAEFNGAAAGTKLPLAATYIIRPDGTIAYAFLDADYRKRAEPDTIVAELQKLGR